MKHPDANDIRRFTQKLREEGDISLAESNRIYSLLSKNSVNTKLNPRSSEYDYKVSIALQQWYGAVAEEIKKGKRGNFVFTVDLKTDLSFICFPAQKVLNKYKNFKDLCNVIKVDKKAYSLLPFKHLFTEIWYRPNLESFYELRSDRAGTYYRPIKTKSGHCTIEQFLEKFSPIVTDDPMDTIRMPLTAFEIAVGAVKMPQDSSFLAGYETKPYILGIFMKRRNISCITAFDNNNDKAFLFVEKENEPVMKKVSEFPLKELVKNALSQGVIDETMAEALLNKRKPLIWRFPTKDFVETSVDYIDGILKMEKEWETARKTVREEEDFWLDSTR